MITSNNKISLQQNGLGQPMQQEGRSVRHRTLTESPYDEAELKR